MANQTLVYRDSSVPV